MANTAWVTSSRLGGSSDMCASNLSNQASTYACSCWRARVLAKVCRVSSQERTAAGAIGGSSTGGLKDDLCRPPYHSGVLQRTTRKNYVMHPWQQQQVTLTLKRAVKADEDRQLARQH